MSVAVAIGFIAMACMAVEIGVPVLSFINIEIASGRSAANSTHNNSVTNKAILLEEIKDAVRSATSKRVRFVVMTAISTTAGLVPIMVSGATGSDATHRIATPMPGDMLTVTVLNLLVLPVIYSLVLEYRERSKNRTVSVQADSV